ncbi:hypothetical protein A3A76_01655 [Candidatus Woesebacteria bacterium RIFCSPLOWO2_01_FULL_39_23]|uniref:Uncharacterized protein n=1 Tax=Candidatus Woesebacteria bacterium RIFCSPHIGHO2_01_FULL_40_22 TaxID=1802499 RepID=A0A1F7YFY0_9BACT|nr:MAG: hypothetical protein A2141_02230 [Candidatus Woesebacteria bacterium RBG_16_40_11]OGM25789.1 MAG: hypothetical protein A2628_00510 [Candidatus Woesebacteria bacterium RIFCSPHIGHO2_01_FULL_40_22]OGM36389.1 MAG: hypothetical protein A3E41_04870 [Candidatus Woesebacteria bacterium RIFCSPHIGHO2_12_FULL_38_9]OGM61741.1 MAG: hypothetical protein A3A76_01655 [Candidatus Woesebacteria bacterium RIFCSPLOWO2_01_FULL_39_23]
MPRTYRLKKILTLPNLLFILILLIGLFFRLYKITNWFEFGHEQDLQSWIVKDIIIDKHPRLIGQETSITGLFIGPLYYYSLILSFLLLKLDPIASFIPVTLFSLATIISVYFVFSKLYGKKVGLIGSFIYSASISITLLDRWAVPTQPTLLWIIWYLYVLISFTRGKFESLPILIVLLGLIWHIHVAFVPLLILIPTALVISGKNILVEIRKIKKHNLIIAVIILFLLMAPFIIFELRHGFQQISGLTKSLSDEKGALTGAFKLEVILKNIDRVLGSILLFGYLPTLPKFWIFPSLLILFFLLVLLITKLKIFKSGEAIIIYLWILDVALSHYMSKRPLSEYYFNNLIIPGLLVYSLLLSAFLKFKKGNILLISILILLAILNSNKLVTRSTPRNEYQDKKKIVDYIASYSKEHSYPCISVNYIGDIGMRYGYRYLMWWKNLDVISSGSDVAVFSIVNPFNISEKEITYRSADIGVIIPKNTTINPEVCSKPERQLIPLNGFLN